MSFITTNPNPFIINVPELQGVLTSVTGASASSNTISEYVDTITNAASFNSIGSYNSGTIAITSDLYLSNANIYVNDSPVIIGNNTINGNGYTAFTINNVEQARLNSNGFNVVGSMTFQSGGVSNASINVNGSTQTLTIANGSGDIAIATDADIVLNGTTMLTNTAGAPTGNYIRIKINGTYYKLALLADT
jgi:hypothetical protein